MDYLTMRPLVFIAWTMIVFLLGMAIGVLLW
jgi:hypothetical protein